MGEINTGTGNNETNIGLPFPQYDTSKVPENSPFVEEIHRLENLLERLLKKGNAMDDIKQSTWQRLTDTIAIAVNNSSLAVHLTSANFTPEGPERQRGPTVTHILGADSARVK